MKELTAHFHKLAKYELHCNAALIEAIEQNNVSDEKVMRLMSHIGIAQQVWLMRILAEPATGPVDIWEIVPVTVLRERLAANMQRMTKAIDMLSEPGSTTIAYTNIVGTPYTNELQDILHHILNHGTYHRGQIATRLRELGLKLPGTDYILYIREHG
ncbi:hypothetical protein GCM10023093_31010 [Nemorincola caseinilytica]|uniref:Damage-inducible protein DinB n=1 Tax=Nemorincola caseinilytica TaxID=2054315 RepID=A0ABP8NSL5_9BACT